MSRCLQLASQGLGTTYPNPLVGSVIVANDQIIGEGWHQKAGGPHAEVNAINSVSDKKMLEEATLYVNLEPCSHHGRTPPCADLIVDHQIRRVIIATMDPNKRVQGKGIDRLVKNGVEVKVGVMEKEARILNRRFFTYHQKKRPYIILKWAQSADSFIFPELSQATQGGPIWISNPYALQQVHYWRGQEEGILVGNRTVLHDNPRLNLRGFKGRDPVRILIDKDLKVQEDLKFFDGSQNTIIFNGVKSKKAGRIEWVLLDFSSKPETQILEVLYKKELQSLIIEGGSITLLHFIENGLWDEARVFTGPGKFYQGIQAPKLNSRAQVSEQILDNLLEIFYNSH